MEKRLRNLLLSRGGSSILLFRSTLALLLGVALSACGFTPLHQSQSTATAHSFAAIEYQEDNRTSTLPATFEKRFQIKKSEPFRLLLHIKKARRTQGLTRNADIDRLQLDYQLDLKIIDKESGTVIFTRSLSAITSLSRNNDELQNREAERREAENLTSQLATKAQTEIRIFFAKAISHEINRK